MTTEKANCIRALLVDEVEEDARGLIQLLVDESDPSFAVEWIASRAQAFKRLSEGSFHVILLRHSPQSSARSREIQRFRQAAPHVPIIVLSETDDENLAVNAVHGGAQDYLVREQITRPLLIRSIRYSIERKRAETELLHVEERYRNIFENTVEGIFQTSADGKYLDANPPLARIYGYDSPEELMKRLTDIGSQLYVDPERRAEFVRLLQKNNVVTNFESRVRRRDGEIIWISENCRAVRSRQGKLLFYEGTVQDVTERRLAEEKLRTSEALYHSLVENLPQNIFRKDLTEHFTFANQRFCLTLGRSLDEIVGKTDFDFFPPELAEKYQQDDREILATGKIFETIEEHHPPNAGKIYVNVVKTPLYDSRGRINGLQGIFWDITEKKKAEENLKSANAELARHREELRQKNEQMEEDLRMAHEIQQAILPQQYPAFPRGASPQDSALQFTHRYFPTGAVGGDFFNVVALSDSKAGVFICDVMGHGVRSALVTAIMRALVEELHSQTSDPGELLTQINRDFCAILKQSGTPLFTTAFYLVVDLENRDLHFANAGHPKPLLVHRATGQVDLLKNADGVSRPALGLFEGVKYQTFECRAESQDMIMLFTDGLYDVSGPGEAMFGPEWLLDEVQRRANSSANELFDDLLAVIRESSAGGEFTDDICMVGVEIR